MVRISVSGAVLCLTFITVSLAGPVDSTCKILEVSSTAAESKLIRVGCGEKGVTVDLFEGEFASSLNVVCEHGRHLLTVEYSKEQKDMVIVIEGERFDAKDADTEEKEAAKFKQLLDNPEFDSFPEAVKLIHDELQLKGWESHAVMFLYRLGMACEKYRNIVDGEGSSFIVDPAKVDDELYDYNGPLATEQCKYNGWSDPSMDNLIATECRGICGRVCQCWKWVCDDCCMHTGCERHDDFCSKSYFTKNCITARGVLWDTITNVPHDC